MDTFKLLSAEKKLRADNDIHLVGALIPNVNNTQRIDQLESIVSDPNDAINTEFTKANLNNIWIGIFMIGIKIIIIIFNVI